MRRRRVVCQCSRVATTLKRERRKTIQTKMTSHSALEIATLVLQLYSYVFIHVEIVNILFLKLCISPFVHHTTTAVVDRIKAGTLDVDYFCLGCHVEIMGPCTEHPLFCGSLCNRECKVSIKPQWIRLEFYYFYSDDFGCRTNFLQRVTALARTIYMYYQHRFNLISIFL
jgi:hypothetical protein